MSGESAATILRELVAIQSVSADSNLPLLNHVSERLDGLGWQVRLMPYCDEAGIAKANLIARPAASNGGAIELAFVCHTDTVPFAASWPAALELQERDGSLHGCGACDVKGALAAFLAAAQSLGGDVDASVALILTADEEAGCNGMERLLAETELEIVSAIVSEPTSLRPGIAGKGYGLARITVEGREAHSAFPARGVSAISIAAKLIARIEAAWAQGGKDEMQSEVSSLFDPPHTTINIGVIEGGSAKNIVPGRCMFLVEWRAVPGEQAGAVVARMRELIEAAGAAEPRAAIHFEVLRDEAGFAPHTTAGVLQQRLAALTRRPPVGISFGSEATRLARVAQEIVVIGPGDMQTAHSERECVPEAELEQWVRVLRQLLRRS